MAIAIYKEAVCAAPRCCPAKSGLRLSRFFDNRCCDYRAVETVTPKVPLVFSGDLSPVCFTPAGGCRAFSIPLRGITDLPGVLLPMAPLVPRHQGGCIGLLSKRRWLFDRLKATFKGIDSTALSLATQADLMLSIGFKRL